MSDTHTFASWADRFPGGGVFRDGYIGGISLPEDRPIDCGIDGNPLTLSAYQARTAHTAIYPGSGEILGMAYATLGLAGEAGEVAGKLKKIIRDGGGKVTVADCFAMEKELGDVLWYLARTASEFGLDLGELASKNLAKLADRKARGVLGGSGDDR